VSSIVFKEWLPDQPELGNGGLIRALNVLPTDGGYAPFRPLDTSGGTITQNSIEGSFLSSGVTKNAARLYAYAAGEYYMGAFAGPFATRGSATSGGVENFVQYDNLVIGTNPGHFPTKHTSGSASNFTALATNGTAPAAAVIGVVNQFVVLGSIGAPGTSSPRASSIQWSSVDQPERWPAPNSATAIAEQSGEQDLATIHGEVMSIHGGDQYAVILQKSAVIRMTYVGPPVVFQFDAIDVTQGQFFPRGSVQVGRLVYFVSEKGFCRTDGVTVEPIGAGKVDRYFWEAVYTPTSGNMSCGYDRINDLVYFAYAVALGAATKLLIFNPKSNQWTHADQTLDEIVGTANYISGAQLPVVAFNSGSSCIAGVFQATAGSAVLETGEMQLTEAGRTYIDGLKPNVESSGTAPAISCRIGYRDSLGTAPSYTSTTSAFARTGVANFRVDAKYHRFETQIVGNFEKVTGVEFDADSSGYA
jgi:hypothetical protein